MSILLAGFLAAWQTCLAPRQRFSSKRSPDERSKTRGRRHIFIPGQIAQPVLSAPMRWRSCTDAGQKRVPGEGTTQKAIASTRPVTEGRNRAMATRRSREAYMTDCNHVANAWIVFSRG